MGKSKQSGGLVTPEIDLHTPGVFRERMSGCSWTDAEHQAVLEALGEI